MKIQMNRLNKEEKWLGKRKNNPSWAKQFTLNKYYQLVKGFL
ncbi:hypothetical protein [Bacillus seohaeanensis]|uniref:Uncharacterized protein n=1 Tax=Bacillus seohaeanensis TaxID=284580 RepID=A0ABW5RWD2_9BACI